MIVNLIVISSHLTFEGLIYVLFLHVFNYMTFKTIQNI